MGVELTMIPVLVMALAAQTPWGRIDPPPGLECVSRGSEALVLQPEEFLAAPHVRRISLSPTGAHALLTSTTEAHQPLLTTPTRLSILTLDRRMLRPALELSPGEASQVQVEWAPGDRAYLLISRPDREGTHHQIHELDARSGQIRIVGQNSDAEIGPFPQLFVSPQGRVVLFGQKVEVNEGGGPTREEFIFQNVGSSGLEKPQVFTRETSGPLGAEWAAAGNILRLKVERGDVVRGQVRPEFASYDLVQGTLNYEMRGAEPEANAPDFALVRRRPTVEANRWEHKVDTLWLEAAMPADEPSAFVAAEPEAWALSPRLDYILYSSKGALWMRVLKKMRIAEVRELQIKTIQERATAQAQRMGRAVVLYWRDNGHEFPVKRHFHNAIRAYNEDDEAIGRFVATFEGGPVRLGTNTATTAIGYIDAKIGRAYVMLDGHVRWEFNPKSN